MKNINILIVEDKQSHITEWGAAIFEFNLLAERADKKIELSCEFAKSYGEAKKLLATFNFSVAIIDIRLAEDNGEPNENNTKGNDVLLDIVRSTMCLAWVYTGQQTDADIPQYLEDYIELIDRSAQSKSELLETLESKRDIIDSITEIKQQFSQSKAEHFYSSIWPRWSLWSQDDKEFTDKAIVRHMATHLHASFLNETKNVHPEEYYFTGPMIEGKLDTGDITLIDGTHYILVTPRCEIAQDKNIFYQFVELEDKSEIMEQKVAELVPLSADLEQKKAAVKEKKKSLAGLKQLKIKATKAKNTQKTLVNQAIVEKNKAEEVKIADLNSKIATETQTLFKLESDEIKSQNDILKKENELAQAEIELKKSDKKEQGQKSSIKDLLPSSKDKASLHILPVVKQPKSITYGPLHAKFEKITYIAKTDNAVVERYEQGKYARLSNEFIPSFVERLGSHFSRIGTPDYSHPE